MKIALVHEFLTKLGGAEQVLQIFADMFPQAPIYTLLYNEQKTGHIFPANRIKTSYLQKYYKIIPKHQIFLPWMHRAIEYLDFSGFDLVLSSSSAFAHGIITPLKTKHICYCHSPMRYSWDYTHEYRKEKSKGFLSSFKNYYISKTLASVRLWDKIAADRPDHYIANAKTVQKRIQKYYQLDSDIIYPPIDIERFTVSHEHDNFFLIVSRLSSYKKKLILLLKHVTSLINHLLSLVKVMQKKNSKT